MNEPLPILPVPEAPTNPACEWCGKRPAKLYEVAPPVFGAKVGHDARGRQSSSKVITKRAITAYACRYHEQLFDRQKADIAAARERRKREMKGERT